MIELTEQMREALGAAIAEGNVALVATAATDGEPDIAFKGSTMVWDGEHLAFWERSKGQTLRNMEANPKVCVLYRSRERAVAWKFFGVARLLTDGDLRQQIMDKTTPIELDRDPERTGVAVLIRVDRVLSAGKVLMQRD